MLHNRTLLALATLLASIDVIFQGVLPLYTLEDFSTSFSSMIDGHRLHVIMNATWWWLVINCSYWLNVHGPLSHHTFLSTSLHKDSSWRINN